MISVRYLEITDIIVAIFINLVLQNSLDIMSRERRDQRTTPLVAMKRSLEIINVSSIVSCVEAHRFIGKTLFDHQLRPNSSNMVLETPDNAPLLKCQRKKCVKCFLIQLDLTIHLC